MHKASQSLADSTERRGDLEEVCCGLDGLRRAGRDHLLLFPELCQLNYSLVLIDAVCFFPFPKVSPSTSASASASAPLPRVLDALFGVDFEILSSMAKLIYVTLINEYPREPT